MGFAPDPIAVAGVGLILGLRHAFEPDHLAAVSTLATRQGRLLPAAGLGLAWGVGHTAAVGAVVLVVIGLGIRVPAALWPAAEVGVGVLLVALGASVIARYVRGRWHMHRHAHPGTAAPHFHLHSHATGAGHAHAHARGDVRRSLGFGLLHGLAGSAAVIVLLVAAAPTAALRAAYFLMFGFGTVLGMLAVSVTLGIVVRAAAGRGERWARVIHLSAATASVVVGIALAGAVLVR